MRDIKSADGQEESNAHSAPLWHGPAAGAISSIASRVVTYPADTVKAQQQLRGVTSARGYSSSTLSAFQQVVRAEGLSGFYRGFGAVLSGVVPATALYFGGYETGKQLIPAGYGFLGDMLVGCYSQAIAGIVFTPVDIIKERMQVQGMMQGAFTYRSTFHAVSSIMHQHGLPGLMKGYWATNSVWFPWNMIYIASYERSKTALAQQLQLRDAGQLPGWGIAICSAGSAALAAWCTHPADVVKTRLQVLSAKQGFHDLRAGDVANQLWQSAGLRGFGQGLLARTLTIAPGAAIQWFIYERVKVHLPSIKSSAT
ncbi:hypothetical protein ABBQ32_003968 [Trebouxia sp. C0010 RCD-2024]